jgi:hypothetical protein
MLSKEREIDVLMIFHKFDSKPIFLTNQFCYEMDEDLTSYFGEAEVARKLKANKHHRSH